jgi:hypothetical protein
VSGPSLSVAFRKHVEEVHAEKKKLREEVHQAGTDKAVGK